MKFNSLLVMALFGSSAILSGCGVLKDTGDMMTATKKMPALMGQTIDGMNTTNKMMAEMCKGQGKLSTSDYRDKLLDQIDQSKDIGRKLSLAVKYHYAWEFQGMNKECGRTDEYSKKVFNESIREFLESMHRFIDSRSKTSATSMDNDMNSLYAIVATMHYTNSLQEQDADLNGYKAVSMLDLLSDVVDASAKINAGTLSTYDLPAYVDSGRILLGDVSYLLKLRYNFLSAFAFGLATTDIVGDEATLFGKAKYVLDGIFNRPWSPDFTNKNTSQINYYTLILERSMEARNLIEKLGENPATDKTIFKVYRSLNVDGFDARANSTDPLNVKEKKDAVIKFKRKVEDYLNGSELK